MGEIYNSTVRSVEAAGPRLSEEDEGAVSVLLALAERIEAQREQGPEGKMDIVSMPTYLKYCESLGLTPAAREKLAPKRVVEVDPVDELRAARHQRSA